MTDSTPSDTTDALAFAEATVRRAGELLTASYERVERIDYKSARDVVTEVDYASEELVARRDPRALPGRRHPGGGIGPSPAPEPARPFAGRTWVVDPLDGTVNYANGIPYFCVSMGLVDAGRAAAGRDPGSAARRPVRRDRRRPGNPQRGAGARLRRRSSWATTWSAWR